MTIVMTVLNALIAIPKIAGYVESFAQSVTLWWVQRQNSQTQAMIADAAALAARAQNDADRYKAADAWHAAISRPRVSG